MYNDIVEFYLTKWKLLWNYKNPCIGDIWFEINNLKYLINKMKKNKFFIEIIEIFKKNDLSFYPSDFYYSWGNFIENYKLIDKFLYGLVFDLNNYYYTLVFKDSLLENIINELLCEKYKQNISEEEKQERKNKWWYFIE